MASIVSFMNRSQLLDADTHLAERIVELVSGQQIAVLITASGRIVIRGDIRRFYDGSGIAGRLQESLVREKCQWVRVDEQDDCLAECLPHTGRPLEELLWTLAFSEFSERKSCLNNGCRRDDVVRLNHWPNLTRVPFGINSHRLAALFSARPTSIALAGKILGVDESEVLQFYNAAWYAGLVTRVNRTAEPVTLVRHRNQSLISSLLKHLRRAPAAQADAC
jgi:hypothetical protein